MKKSLLYFFLVIASVFFCQVMVLSQNVGIGTTTPQSKAILDVAATDKGVLFPRMTSEQRNAITDPPNGLHIFNTDQRCLNYYDSSYKTWNCYCVTDTCKVVTISIASGCAVDFYNTYGINYPGARKFVLLIEQGVTLSCGGLGLGALNFSTYPVSGSTSYDIRIINRGTILGGGGTGGTGSTGHPGGCYRNATPGGAGGDAIATRPGVIIRVENYGFIAAGGGGGGGGGGSTNGQYGGGGGGGAGTNGGNGGSGGGNTISIFGGCATSGAVAQNGTSGLTTTGGSGGTGSNGGTGGAGGARGVQGQPGTGTFPGAGGLPGKAINGSTGTGNSIVNLGSGQTIGAVD
jgi:hypothetical protein